MLLVRLHAVAVTVLGLAAVALSRDTSHWSTNVRVADGCCWGFICMRLKLVTAVGLLSG